MRPERRRAISNLLQLPGGPYNPCHCPSVSDMEEQAEGKVSNEREGNGRRLLPLDVSTGDKDCTKVNAPLRRQEVKRFHLRK